MTQKENLFTAAKYEDAVKNGIEYYNVESADDLNIKIIQKASNGFLGIHKRDWILSIKLKEKKIPQETVDLRVEEALKISEEMDGYFSLEYKDKFAYLTVYPPGKTGLSVSIEEVWNRIRVLKLENIDEQLLNKTVRNQSGIAVKIGEWPHAEALNGWFKIEVSDDNLEAFITMFPPKPGGKELNYEDIIEGLQTKGTIFKINEEEIKKSLNEKIYFKKISVVKGIAPKKGRDAKINYFFNLENKAKPQIIDDKGNVDLKELGLIQSVRRGDIVSEKIPAEKGEAGTNVYGRIIPAVNGEDKNFIFSKDTIELSEDGLKLISKIDGRILIKDNKIVVEKVLHINSDVNYHTGNINFNGTVIIQGKVEDNFKVEADGDIIVKKNTGKSFIYSRNNVIIEGGILGKGESLVKAEKNVYAKFIENGNVLAGENIFVDKVIMHSNISAGDSIILKGEKGAIIGGITRAGKQIIANELGAVGGTYTEIEAGIDPKILSQLNELNEKRVQDISRVNKIALGVETLERKRLTNTITEKELEQLKQLKAMLDKATSKLDERISAITQIRNLIKPDFNAKVKVKNLVYAGTKIIIANSSRYIKDDNKYSFVTFKYGEKELKILPY